jgi:hypothetical protein
MSDRASSMGREPVKARDHARHYWRVAFDGDEVSEAFLDAVTATLAPAAPHEPPQDPGEPDRAAADRATR